MKKRLILVTSLIALTCLQTKAIDTKQKELIKNLDEWYRVSLEAALIGAASAGDSKGVATLLSKGADVNAKYGDTTPLMLAALQGHDDVVKFLIGHGALTLVERSDGKDVLDITIPIAVATIASKEAKPEQKKKYKDIIINLVDNIKNYQIKVRNKMRIQSLGITS